MFKIFLLFKLFLFTSLTVQANSKIQNFEGSINLKKETVYDTTLIAIHVKGPLVRIDEMDQRKNLLNSYIINLDDKSVMALSPQRKLYSEVKNMANNQKEKRDTQLIRTNNCMVYNGYKCSQMRVKCKSRDTEIAYWVSQEKFEFFSSLLKVLKSTKINLDFFEYFPETEGFFPVLTINRTLMRKERMKLAVANIQKEILSENRFRIPLDYQKIE